MFQTLSVCRRLSLVLAVLLIAAPAGALDQIKTTKATISGTIQDMGKFEVKIKRTGQDREETVQVNDIEYIQLDGEPAQLRLIRSALNGGRYKDALDGLSKLKEDTLKAEIKNEMAFLRALASAKLALAGEGALADAANQMKAFIAANGTNWHYLQANEVLGDMYAAVNSYPLAQQRYAELEQAPWADVKMRGSVLKGRALQGEGKFDEAAAAFDAALKLGGGQTGEQIEAQRQAATIGKGVCLAQTDKPAEAIKLLEEVVAKADPEQAELHALAYNALGGCYRKANNPKAALLAYLHVDVLYNTFPNAHAEALANLVELWKEVGNADRALESEQVLTSRYPTSKWAKK